MMMLEVSESELFDLFECVDCTKCPVKDECTDTGDCYSYLLDFIYAQPNEDYDMSSLEGIGECF